MLIPHGAHILVIDAHKACLLRNRGTDRAPELEVVSEQIAHEGQPPAGRQESHLTGRALRGDEFERRDRHRDARFGQMAFALAHEGAADGAPLILVAPPHMLGILREVRPHAPARPVIAEVGKDYVSLPPHEIGARLQRIR